MTKTFDIERYIKSIKDEHFYNSTVFMNYSYRDFYVYFLVYVRKEKLLVFYSVDPTSGVKHIMDVVENYEIPVGEGLDVDEYMRGYRKSIP